MTKDKLRTYISIIFKKEKRQLSKMGKTWNLIPKENKTELVYHHANTLIDIYANIHSKKELKEDFLDIMKTSIKSNYEYYQTVEIYIFKCISFFCSFKTWI